MRTKPGEELLIVGQRYRLEDADLASESARATFVQHTHHDGNLLDGLVLAADGEREAEFAAG